MSTSEKLTASLPAEMIEAIDHSVAAGRYTSRDEVLRDALSAWQRQKMSDADYFAELQAHVRRSLDDPRPSVSAGDVRERLATLHEETVKAQGHGAA
ncbi:MAG: hypothetical protein NVSMB26_18140 [Beijerinckiaceae bacterium]